VKVDVEAFETFVSILSSGDASGFEKIPRDGRAEMELNDPQATYAFDLAGLDSAATALSGSIISDDFRSNTAIAAYAGAVHSGTRERCRQRQATSHRRAMGGQLNLPAELDAPGLGGHAARVGPANDTLRGTLPYDPPREGLG
jgi:hypothetical protein